MLAGSKRVRDGEEFLFKVVYSRLQGLGSLVSVEDPFKSAPHLVKKLQSLDKKVEISRIEGTMYRTINFLKLMLTVAHDKVIRRFSQQPHHPFGTFDDGIAISP